MPAEGRLWPSDYNDDDDDFGYVAGDNMIIKWVRDWLVSSPGGSRGESEVMQDSHIIIIIIEAIITEAIINYIIIVQPVLAI